MFDMECAQKFCKDCLDKMPEKDREAMMKSMEKFAQSMGKGFETCCQTPGDSDNAKKK